MRFLTIDVEEYFHIEAAYRTVGPARWKDWPSRVERNVDLLLELMDRQGVKGTWFFLGDVARRQPGLAPRVAAAGHEIASHGTMHDRLHRLDADRFREDLLTSKGLLEDQTGRRVIGYRAPTFSVMPQTAWAIDVLAESGFSYDASIFPVTHPAYGVPAAPDRPFRVRGPGGAELLEAPPLTWTPPVGAKKLAVAGGGYFRLLPLWFMKRGLSQAGAEGRPAVLYFHPWEFDPEMPRLPLSRTGMIRTYTGLRSAARKLESILARRPATWATMQDELESFRAMAAQSPVFDLAHASAAGARA
jgi:polysaccharide deacetylase family protein (PEP-CTERM system associated)